MKHHTGFSLPSILIGILLMLAMSNALQVQAQPDPPLPDATRSDPASVGIPAPLDVLQPLGSEHAHPPRYLLGQHAWA